MERFKFKKEDIEKVKELYLKLKSSKKVANIFGCDVRTVLRFLHKNNVKVDMRSSKTKYYVNSNAFDTINNDSSYWLGFLMADGSHNEKLNNFSLVQRTTEKENLNKLKLFLSYDGVVKDYVNNITGTKYSRLYITDLKLSKKLSELGVIQNKTHKLVFPNYINNRDLFRNFLRGYFDGDGSISCGLFTLVGTNNFLTVLQENLINYLGLNKTLFNKRHKNRKNEIYTMSYGGRNNILKLFKFMYEDVNYFSDYKYKKYIKDYNKKWYNQKTVKTDINLLEWFNKKI